MRPQLRHANDCPPGHARRRTLGVCARLGLLCVLFVHWPGEAQQRLSAAGAELDEAEPSICLPSGDGYLRARLDGALKAELDWGNEGTGCSGTVRPDDDGIRMRFAAQLDGDDKLVLVFGISSLREGQAAKAVPVNVTVIREGTGEFYGTQGDDKCRLDEVHQTPIIGPPHRSRIYRVEARGYCTQPARAIRGEGAVLISRFDFAGRVDFDDDNEAGDGSAPQMAAR